MADMNDMDLMREYTDRNSEPAFAELVHRHINLVYSVALRGVGNSQDAQDVTQAVFIILARKITSLRQRSTLTGWLYETTRFTARQLLRTRNRQQTREQEAYMQSALNDSDNESVWRQLAPVLEEAMARLNEKERALLALRFYENKSGAEAAALLGIEEQAAHKRTARAVEKMRAFFARRGLGISAGVLIGVISANSVQAAPIGLAKIISAVAIAKGATAGGSTLTLAKGAFKLMAWTKMKTAVIAGAIILLAVGTTTTLVIQHREHLPKPQPVSFDQTEFPKASWAFAGYSDPESALQSCMWAANNGDVKALLASLSSASRQRLAGRPRDQILTAKDKADYAKMTGYHILEKQVVSENEVLLEVHADGLDQTKKLFMQRIGNEWKLGSESEPEPK